MNTQGRHLLVEYHGCDTSVLDDQDRIETLLVAAAVPEMDSKDVVVVDQSGSLLSDGADDMSLRRSQRDLALVRAHERTLHTKIANILAPWVGRDRYQHWYRDIG